MFLLSYLSKAYFPCKMWKLLLKKKGKAIGWCVYSITNYFYLFSRSYTCTSRKFQFLLHFSHYNYLNLLFVISLSRCANSCLTIAHFLFNVIFQSRLNNNILMSDIYPSLYFCYSLRYTCINVWSYICPKSPSIKSFFFLKYLPLLDYWSA